MNRVQNVPDVQPLDRSGRSHEFGLICSCEGHYWFTRSILYPARDQTYDSLVPAAIIHADASWYAPRKLHAIDDLQCLFLHLRLYLPALFIQPIQFPRHFLGPPIVILQQTFYSQRHVAQPTRGIDPGSNHETQI